jgi:hypothetical protein
MKSSYRNKIVFSSPIFKSSVVRQQQQLKRKGGRRPEQEEGGENHHVIRQTGRKGEGEGRPTTINHQKEEEEGVSKGTGGQREYYEPAKMKISKDPHPSLLVKRMQEEALREQEEFF